MEKGGAQRRPGAHLGSGCGEVVVGTGGETERLGDEVEEEGFRDRRREKVRDEGKEAGREAQGKIKNERPTERDCDRKAELDNDRQAHGQKEKNDTHAELQKGSE